jgi:outer membrane protein assembly factor BamB
MSSQSLFLGDTVGQLQTVSYDPPSNTWVPGQDWAFKRISGASESVIGPILDGSNLIAAVQDAGVVTVASSNGTIQNSYPLGGASTSPGTPSSIAGGVAIGMTTSSGPELLLGSSLSVPTTAQINAAPLAGDNNRLYTVDSSGSLQTWSQSDLTPSWTHNLSSTVSASPNLSCGTSGAPGTLYVATETGQLYAIVSDSIGLDSTASWPKYQHDQRNTGNPATALSCP